VVAAHYLALRTRHDDADFVGLVHVSAPVLEAA
jgi:hypothetical protein